MIDADGVAIEKPCRLAANKCNPASGKCINLCFSFDVGDRTSHQNRILAAVIFHTNSIRILPAHSPCQGVTRGELNFDVLFVSDDGLDLANAG